MNTFTFTLTPAQCVGCAKPVSASESYCTACQEPLCHDCATVDDHDDHFCADCKSEAAWLEGVTGRPSHREIEQARRCS